MGVQPTSGMSGWTLFLALSAVAYACGAHTSEVPAPVRVKKAVAELSASTTLAADALTIIAFPSKGCDASQNMAGASWAAMQPKPQILLVGVIRTQCIDSLVNKYGAQFVKTDETAVPDIINAGERVAENDVIMFVQDDLVMPSDFAATALHATKAHYREHQFADPQKGASVSQMFKPPVLVGSRADCSVDTATEMSHSMLRTEGNCYNGACNGADYVVFVRGFWGATETPAFTHGQKHWDSFFLVAGQQYGHLVDLSPVVEALRIPREHVDEVDSTENYQLFVDSMQSLGVTDAAAKCVDFDNAAETRMCPSCTAQEYTFVARDTEHSWSHNYCLRVGSDTLSSYEKKCQKLTKTAKEQGGIDAAQSMKSKIDALNTHWNLVTRILSNNRNIQKAPVMRRYSSDSSSASSSDSSSASSSASSSTATTPAPTPSPTTPAPTDAATSAKTITQAVTFNIDVSAYTGNTKLLYERGYGKELGIYDTTTLQFQDGCGVDSSAVTARRATTVTFVATASATYAANAEAQATALVSDTSSLQTAITETKTALGGDFASIATPTNVT